MLHGVCRTKGSREHYEAYVSVPSAEDIEQLILEKKKRMLLEKYSSQKQIEQNEEATELLDKGEKK